jgi:hypothetical protein
MTYWKINVGIVQIFWITEDITQSKQCGPALRLGERFTEN